VKTTNQKEYFNTNWKDIDIYLVPLYFSIPSIKIRNKFEKIIKKSISIADLGCGLGGNAKFFNILNPKIQYTGFDISNKAITKAKKYNKIPNTNYIVKNLDGGYLPKHSFSTIYCSQLLEHLKNDEHLIKQINNSLNTNGFLIISTVFKKKKSFYLYKNIYNQRVLAPDHINEYSDTKNLFNKLKNNNFKIICYDLSLFKFPIIDPLLKILMKLIKKNYITKIVNSSMIMFIRHHLTIPIYGFYNFQIIAKKI